MHIARDFQLLPEFAVEFTEKHALESAGILFIKSPIRVREEFEVGCVANRYAKWPNRTVAQNLKRHDLTRFDLSNRDLQMTRIMNVLAVETGNHIAYLETGLIG